MLTTLIDVLRSLPESCRPAKVIGCEVWRDLDWLPDDEKVVMDLSANPELATQLNGIFKSQIVDIKIITLKSKEPVIAANTLSGAERVRPCNTVEPVQGGAPPVQRHHP